MVTIKPFKGIHYNTNKITPLDPVMSPPYDIISPTMQDQLHQQHPNNFVRLILGKEKPNDPDYRYSSAQQLFTQWQKEHILTQDDTPAIYPYKIRYTLNNKPVTMTGFFTLLKLDPNYKHVRAHERTLSKPKADRLNLMKACQANLEPIQLLYIDSDDHIRKNIEQTLEKPLINVTGYDGFQHTLYKTTDTTLITKIHDFLQDNILFIADGHHRYQTAINYAKNQPNNPEAPYNYRMVILANMFDPGLAILPTHRLITHPTLNQQELLNQLKEYFTIETHTIDTKDTKKLAETITDQLQTTDQHKFALYTKDQYHILTLKDTSIMDELAKDRSPTWRTLDVSILHKIIIEKHMNITENTLEDHVKYTRSDTEALDLVNNHSYNLSILMNPTKIEELKTIADAGEHMPQKSTYFLPKMLSGLVMYKMEK